MTSPRADRWCLVVPVKRLAVAKTRLSGLPAPQPGLSAPQPGFSAPQPGLSAPHRQDLALAFALDTVCAALACPAVEAVLVVTDEPDAGRRLRDVGALVVADEPDAGLNPALAYGAAAVSRAHPECGVGALSADLPALRASELGVALARATGAGACFVRDAHGAGTTALVAHRPGDFVPAFGPDSAAAHLAAGAIELTGADMDSLRHDVDTPADLEWALSVGVGPHTAEVARHLARTGYR